MQQGVNICDFWATHSLYYDDALNGFYYYNDGPEDNILFLLWS